MSSSANIPLPPQIRKSSVIPSEVVSSYSFIPKHARFVLIYCRKCNWPLKRTNEFICGQILPWFICGQKLFFQNIYQWLQLVKAISILIIGVIIFIFIVIEVKKISIEGRIDFCSWLLKILVYYIKYHWTNAMVIVAYILLSSWEAYQEMSLFQEHLFLPIHAGRNFPSSQHLLTNIGVHTGWFWLQWWIQDHLWHKVQQSQGLWHYLAYAFLTPLFAKKGSQSIVLVVFNFLPIWQWSMNFSVLLTSTSTSPSSNSSSTMSSNTSTSSSYSNTSLNMCMFAWLKWGWWVIPITFICCLTFTLFPLSDGLCHCRCCCYFHHPQQPDW